MNDCVFCQLLAGKLPASVVHRDEHCTAFMDIQPVNPGHVLVAPNRHAAGLADLPEADGVHMFALARRIAAALRDSGIRYEGVDLLLEDGEAAGQRVFHCHFHVIPRFKNDGFGFRFGPNYEIRPPREELEALATRLKSNL